MKTREQILEAALRQFIGDSYTCGCSDAGCPARHAERNSVLEALTDILNDHVFLASPATERVVDVASWEALVKAADALNEQAAHVAQGGCIPAMNIHDSARALMPLVAAYDKARDIVATRLMMENKR